MFTAIESFTDSNPETLPPEVEKFIKRHDRRYIRWFRSLFRLGYHYGYTDCLTREPARLLIEPDLKPLGPEDMDLVFTTLMNWSKKKAKDPAALIQSLKASGIVITRMEMPFEDLKGGS